MRLLKISRMHPNTSVLSKASIARKKRLIFAHHVTSMLSILLDFCTFLKVFWSDILRRACSPILNTDTSFNLAISFLLNIALYLCSSSPPYAVFSPWTVEVLIADTAFAMLVFMQRGISLLVYKLGRLWHSTELEIFVAVFSRKLEDCKTEFGRYHEKENSQLLCKMMAFCFVVWVSLSLRVVWCVVFFFNKLVFVRLLNSSQPHVGPRSLLLPSWACSSSSSSSSEQHVLGECWAGKS